jgi:hypothetical protein
MLNQKALMARDFKGKGNPNHVVAFVNKVVLTDIVNDSL